MSVAPPASTADRVKQFIVHTDLRRKRETLDKIICKEEVQNAFIFCNRKRDMAGLCEFLARRGYSVKGMNGDMEQKVRTQTLQEFKDGKVTLLVCSDVAARGLDVDGVSHVFNFDVPFNADDYVHRIGRTGRAGKEGRAWMLATPDEQKYVDAIEKLIKMKIAVEAVDGRGDGSERSAPRLPREEKPRFERQRESQSSRPPRRDAPVATPEADEDDGDVQGFGEEMPGFFKAKTADKSS